MAEKKPASRILFFLITFAALHLSLGSSSSSSTSPRTTYIVHVDRSQMPGHYTHHLRWYSSLLTSVRSPAPPTSSKYSEEEEEEEDPEEEEVERNFIYSYETAFHGFAAKLTAGEAALLENLPGVSAALPETIYHPQTTHSPEFLGLVPPDPAGADLLSTASSAGYDVVIGVLDTGIWPESRSFSDLGFPEPPARWKGGCDVGRGFPAGTCNRKIVGARIFCKGYEASSGAIDDRDGGEYRSPRDQDGHGTHTAATAAGVEVPGAETLGYAVGTARGMAPLARIAAYKVCWSGGCFSSDILAAVDRAVADGVDVLSISLGGGVSSYHRDSLSVAAFGAMDSGVFVACSAGNGGPGAATLTNVSPWVVTVGASTMDRNFPATARLGDGKNFTGVSLYSGRRRLSPEKQYQIVYMGSGNGSAAGGSPASLCLEGTLDRRAVAGKIVICDRGISPRVEKGEVVKEAGGVGMILANTASNGEELVADSHLLPAVALGAAAGRLVKEYYFRRRSSAPATAMLTFEGTKMAVRPSPVVAAFSSRGPNVVTPEVMKPDVVAPGVNILAAWSGAASPSGIAADRRRVGFNILSGTSMSCPHVAGVAALLKARRPEWSPAAVKSALMTTAYVHDNTQRPLVDAASGEPSTAYGHGAGHIRPARAADPGLVYDIAAGDYFEFLCGAMKLTPSEMRVFATPKMPNVSCRHTMAKAGDLNYPAIAVTLHGGMMKKVAVTRTVTNVGGASTYRVAVTAAFKGADVEVVPAVLRFSRSGEKLSYRVVFRPKVAQQGPEFGGLSWSDGVHNVRSSIVVTWMPRR